MNDLQNYVNSHDHYHALRYRIERTGGAMARDLRRKAKLSLRAFATAVDISPSYLSKIENGHMPISAALAQRMLEVTK